MTTTAHPPIADPAAWDAHRRELLQAEKELTKQYDRVNAMRRRLPMTLVEKDYRFTGSAGEVGLADLFDGRRQLIVYHFMFDPDWDKGCPGCTGFVNSQGDLSMLAQRDTTMTLISRAPFEKLAAYRRQHGWTLPWYSSFGSEFNYDYHATLDAEVTTIEYNYRPPEEHAAESIPKGESHGLSVFMRHEGSVYHTYSTYGRGVESVTDAYALLDRTPFGRQEDFEDSPAGWPQRPTYGGWGSPFAANSTEEG
ncbi:hypothetical protein Pla123a_32710 [Posidoniimonas polymericola]|uniref:Thioredoxin domain-containing protein n=1 Tax=Posidoniimonas polymericola TaxID=2528002 RepID=A0A5C5YH03_9BACT|nr:DUF899 domain-containing protein [Posidoniimonas polymericola]TWT74448.1 hypothetical protein Pla123a_32710 [Posidoniimonas polymericola]